MSQLLNQARDVMPALSSFTISFFAFVIPAFRSRHRLSARLNGYAASFSEEFVIFEVSDNRRNNLADAALQLAVVRYRRAERDFRRVNGRDAFGDHLRRVN